MADVIYRALWKTLIPNNGPNFTRFFICTIRLYNFYIDKEIMLV